MFLDLTLKVTPKMVADAQGNETKALVGHVGTHFDVMDKEFPLEYVERPGLLFDVRAVEGRDIEPEDVELKLVGPGMFVAFCSGYSERVEYGSREYFTSHPQLSDRLIEELTARNISMIAVDFGGIRRGKEHTPKDQFCADRGVFVVENLYGLTALLEHGRRFVAHTYPMNYSGVTGLPCRVVAEV